MSSWRGLQRFYESVSVAEASPSEGTAAVAEGLSAFLTKEGEAAPAAGPRGWHVIIDVPSIIAAITIITTVFYAIGIIVGPAADTM